jgi:hypothetical protein
MKRLPALLIAGLAALSFAGTAAASPGLTPHGEVGACNMVLAPGMFPTAVGHANPLGVNGMVRAIQETTGSSSCP